MTLWSVIVSSLLLVSSIEHVFCLVVAGESKAPSRRHFLHCSSSLLIGSAAPLVSHAQQDSEDRGVKPFAPPEALLPATRLKVWVDQAYAQSSSLTSTSDKQTQYDTLKKLNELLSNPPQLFHSSTAFKERTLSSTAQLTTSVSSANKQEYKRTRSNFDSLPDRLAAMLNQADVERQWGMLQYQESKLQKENEMRAAFNYYTTQLQFGGSYLLTASEQDKKRMIRNDKLPTVTAVITADLDVRELYRNTFLTTIEDAKAEVAYQMKLPAGAIDTTDTIDLMDQAYSACTEWFALISPQDVQEALDIVTKESK